MKGRTLWMALVLVLVLVGGAWRLGAAPSRAQGVRKIPRAYGSVKAAIGRVLVFEAPDGTIRYVGVENGELEGTFPRN